MKNCRWLRIESNLRRVVACLVFLAAAVAWATDEPVPRADDVLDRSIAYHDPNGVWETGALRVRERFDLSSETRERLGFDRMNSEILIDYEKGTFRCTTRTGGGDLIEYVVTGDQGEVRLNGSAYTPGDHPLLRRPSAEEAPRHRDLDVYVLGLPMKLRDAGTRVHPDVHVEEIGGRAAYGIDVSYPGGGHSWRFHFDAATGALLRARFYEAGGSLDEGEWFDAEGGIEAGDGLRIPARRTWYLSGEDTPIGTQEIVELERIDALRARPDRSASRAQPLGGDPAAVRVDTSKVEWTPAAAPGFPEGMMRKRLHVNPANGAGAALALHPEGYVEPRHYHTTANHGIYVLEGRLRYGEVEAGPGEFFYAPAGHAHGPIEALEDVEFLIWTDGPLDLHLGDPTPTAEVPGHGG